MSVARGEPYTARVRPLVVDVVPSPFGPVHLAVSSVGVVALQFRTTLETLRRELGTVDGERPSQDDDGRPMSAAGIMFQRAARQLGEYFAGHRRDFDLALDPPQCSAWDRRVFDGVRSIPFGAVTSYGRLARRIGAPGAARAAGGAVGRNPIGLLIPCHRVIAGDGTIGGYGGGWYGSREEQLKLKRALLTLEGVTLPARDLLGDPGLDASA